jgi:LysM repeat protein
MKCLNNTLKTLGVGLAAATLAVGCAAKKPPMAGPSGPATAADTSYTVMRGDCLWNISAMPRIYGNPYQWPLIYKANSSQIKDADLIYPGQTLAIDRSASTSEIQRAINHAKTRGAWSLGVVEESDKAYLAGK